jgi:hypothetical protein
MLPGGRLIWGQSRHARLYPNEISQVSRSRIIKEIRVQLMNMLSVFWFLKISESPKDPNIILIVPCKRPVMLFEVVQVGLLRIEGAIEICQYTLGCA